MEIGGVEIQGDADEDAGVESLSWIGGKVCIIHRIGGDLQHEQLLRKHVGQFFGRDMKSTDGHVDGFHEMTCVPFCPGMPPGMGRFGWRDGFAGTEDAMLECFERLPGAEVGGHADDGDDGRRYFGGRQAIQADG